MWLHLCCLDPAAIICFYQSLSLLLCHHPQSPRSSIKEFSPRRTSNSSSCISSLDDSIDHQRSTKRTLTHSEKNLSLFSQSFNQLITGIKSIHTPSGQESTKSCDKDNNHLNMNFTAMCNRVMRSPKRNKTASMNGIYFEPEEIYLNPTNKERISDFNEYTEECMRKIATIPRPAKSKKKKRRSLFCFCYQATEIAEK